MKELLLSFFKMFLTFIMLLDPIGNTPSFMAVAGGYDRKTQLLILKKAIVISFIVLMVFAIGGYSILTFFGITPGAFYIAGGIIFFTIALEMIQSKPRSKHTPKSLDDPQDAATVAVFPLAFPLIAGPGMITTIMLHTASGPFDPVNFLMVVLATLIGLIIEYWVLRSSSKLLSRIGTTGMFVMEKIVGLILAGLAVQIVYDGFEKLGLLSIFFN